MCQKNDAELFEKTSKKQWKNVKNHEQSIKKSMRKQDEIYTSFFMQAGHQNDTKIHVIFMKRRFRLVKGRTGTHCDTRGLMLHVGRVNWWKKGLKGVVRASTTRAASLPGKATALRKEHCSNTTLQ